MCCKKVIIECCCRNELIYADYNGWFLFLGILSTVLLVGGFSYLLTKDMPKCSLK